MYDIIDINYLIDNDIVFTCNTRKSTVSLFEILHRMGCKWSSGIDLHDFYPSYNGPGGYYVDIKIDSCGDLKLSLTTDNMNFFNTYDKYKIVNFDIYRAKYLAKYHLKETV